MSGSPLAARVRMRPFRCVVCGLVVSAIVAALAVRPPSPLVALDLRVYDVLLRAAGRTRASNRVAIVAVDDRSLAELGQWPWPRPVIGRLVQRLVALGAAVVAFDIVFSEPDRRVMSVPGQPAGDGLPDADADFARTLTGGHVVLGHAFDFNAESRTASPCLLHPLEGALIEAPRAGSPVDQLFHAKGVLCSLPVLSEAAGASGFLNVGVDSDGILRRMPLLIAFGGRVYPSLALAAVRAATGARQVTVTSVEGRPAHLSLDEHDVPLDQRGTLRLRFRSAGGAFPYLSAVDVLNEAVTANAVSGRIVFVGGTALGVTANVATPFDVSYPGIEVHATAADNLLQHDPVAAVPFERVYGALATVTSGLVATGVTVWLGSVWGAVLVGLLTVAMWWAGSAAVASAGVFFSPLYPTIAAVAATVTLSLVRIRHERRRAAADFSELATRVDREMEAVEQQRLENERVLAQTSEREANRLKEEFLAAVSHELRTPMTTILGWLTILRRRRLSDDLRDHGLESIERNAREQARLIENLLAASGIESGTLRLNLRVVDLADVVVHAIDLMMPTAAAKSIAFEHQVPPEPCLVAGDAEWLRQIVWHVLSNAAKFTPAGGQIALTLSAKPDEYELVVSDSGVGIVPEFLPHVFDRFRQGDGSTTRQHGGLGLGLALAQEIVRLHGGTIGAQSDGPGTGAVFTIVLPACKAHDGADPDLLSRLEDLTAREQ